MFLFEIKPRLTRVPVPIREGHFEFFEVSALEALLLPETDRERIWPLFWEHRGGFFAAHCRVGAGDERVWTLEASTFVKGLEGGTGRGMARSVEKETSEMLEPIVDLQSDHYFMGEALRQAQRARAAEEVPVGAVVVREGRVIARAHNQVELLKDATAHAEMLALTQAEEFVGDWRLTDCTLYVTKEPCPMCAGAMVHARLARVVFGAGDIRGGAAGGAMNLLQFPTLNHRCEITAGVREGECRILLKGFFEVRRSRLGDEGLKLEGGSGQAPCGHQL
jgi:tRNA(adenine34) deaminase